MALPTFCGRCFWTLSSANCGHVDGGRSWMTTTFPMSIPRAATMPRADETLAAAARILGGLVRDTSETATPNYSKLQNGVSSHLPGASTAAKEAFENELNALIQRIHYLESRAEVVHHSLPETPGEIQNSGSPFRTSDPRDNYSRQSSDQRSSIQSMSSNRSKRVTNLLAARDQPQDHQEDRTVSEDDISYLREHVEKQADEIASQRQTISDIGQGLRRSEEEARLAFIRVERNDVAVLERELRKHQQANEAFQRALREIVALLHRWRMVISRNECRYRPPKWMKRSQLSKSRSIQ